MSLQPGDLFRCFSAVQKTADGAPCGPFTTAVSHERPQSALDLKMVTYNAALTANPAFKIAVEAGDPVKAINALIKFPQNNDPTKKTIKANVFKLLLPEILPEVAERVGPEFLARHTSAKREPS